MCVRKTHERRAESETECQWARIENALNQHNTAQAQVKSTTACACAAKRRRLARLVAQKSCIHELRLSILH